MINHIFLSERLYESIIIAITLHFISLTISTCILIVCKYILTLFKYQIIRNSTDIYTKVIVDQSVIIKVSFRASSCSSPSLILSLISFESMISFAFMLMK